jgi:putative cell wall-binding protein
LESPPLKKTKADDERSVASTISKKSRKSPEKKFSKTKPVSHDICVEEILEHVKHIQNITETQLEKVHEILRNYKVNIQGMIEKCKLKLQ